jgi:hypothetical protein
MDSKQAKEIPITKKPYRYHFYNSIKRHPFTLGPLYLATVLGIAYGVSTMYANYNMPKVQKNDNNKVYPMQGIDDKRREEAGIPSNLMHPKKETDTETKLK